MEDDILAHAMKLIEPTGPASSQMETQMQSPTLMLMTGAPALSPVQQHQMCDESTAMYFNPDQMDQDIMEIAAGEPQVTPQMPVPMCEPYVVMTSPDSVDATSFSRQINIESAYDMNSPEYNQASSPYQQSVEPNLSASCGLPRITTLMSSPKVQPTVELSDIPESLRFRYLTEIKDKPNSGVTTETNKRAIKIHVGNYVGQLNILVDLVLDSATAEEHVNELYLPAASSSWKKEMKYLVLSDNQIQTTKTYELSSYGVVRMKKDKTGNARSTPSGEFKMSTDRVVFRFRVQFLDLNQQIDYFSNVVVDSKSCNSSGEPKITHVNPTAVRCHDESEITLLCENINAKAKVHFFSECPKFWKEASVTLRHKRFAIVVKAPKFCNTSGGNVKVQIVCSDSMKSEPFDFLYKPESETGKMMMKRPAPYTPTNTDLLPQQSVKQMLYKKLTKNLQTDSKQDADEDEDEVDSIPNGNGAVGCVPSEDEASSTNLLKKLSFGVAAFDYGYDEKFCEAIAMSFEAMTSTDEEGLTPLARAIAYGNVHVVKTFLQSMPEEIKTYVLSQRFGENHLSHLLLASQLKEQTINIMRMLLDSGDDLCAQDMDGNNILHLLLRQENEPAVVELWKWSKGDHKSSKCLSGLLDMKNHEGRTPLHQAVLRGLVTATEALLKAGAKVNEKSTKTGFSALHYAALENGSTTLVQCLLKMPDIDVNATTVGGKTALDLAAEKGFEELCELLRSVNAIHLHQESSDTEEEEDDDDDDDDDDEEEEEEEDSERESSTDEDYVDAIDDPKPITWEELKQELTEKLTGPEFGALARRLDISHNKVRLFEKTKDPSKFFFHQVSREFGHQLPSALRDINRAELADYASRLSQN